MCFTRTSEIIGVHRVSSHVISRVLGRSCVVDFVFKSFGSKEKRALNRAGVERNIYDRCRRKRSLVTVSSGLSTSKPVSEQSTSDGVGVVST